MLPLKRWRNTRLRGAEGHPLSNRLSAVSHVSSRPAPASSRGGPEESGYRSLGSRGPSCSVQRQQPLFTRGSVAGAAPCSCAPSKSSKNRLTRTATHPSLCELWRPSQEWWTIEMLTTRDAALNHDKKNAMIDEFRDYACKYLTYGSYTTTYLTISTL
jgi:hypothetical protein